MPKKLLSILLTLLILILVPLSVYAETTVQPRYAHVMSHMTDLIINSDVADIESFISGDSYVTSIKMTLTLQKKILWWWDDVEEFSDITPSNSIEMYETTIVGSGTYRVKMTARVCFGSGTNYEDIEGYSGEQTN